jgi:hypothetical protein
VYIAPGAINPAQLLDAVGARKWRTAAKNAKLSTGRENQMATNSTASHSNPTPNATFALSGARFQWAVHVVVTQGLLTPHASRKVQKSTSNHTMNAVYAGKSLQAGCKPNLLIGGTTRPGICQSPMADE